MEEADARLQEVVASLLNENGGNHEPALRQTFACLHNSGLYEAQSPAEEEQREQQVLAVFRSFPFRVLAAAENDGGNWVEETQAPPPAYNTLAREPEEAGEVAAQVDPENVGEDAGAQAAAAAPEAQLPLYPNDPDQEERISGSSAERPEVGHQVGSTSAATAAAATGTLSNLPPHPPAGADEFPQQQQQQQQQQVSAASPEGLTGERNQGEGAEGFTEAGGAIGAAAPVEGVQLGGGGAEGGGEAEAGELARGEEEGAAGRGFPETGEEDTDAIFEGRGDTVGGGEETVVSDVAHTNGVIVPLIEVEGRSEEKGEVFEESNGFSDRAADSTAGESGGEEVPAYEVEVGAASGSDPENTRQEPQQHSEHAAGVNGSRRPYPADTTADTTADTAAGQGVENMDTARPVDPTSGAAAAAATVPTTTAVTEPHLKTAGQPLTHSNRAESPTGMSTDVQDKLKALKLRRKHRFLVMRIDGTEVVSAVVGAPGDGPSELKAALPYSDCRYAVYDQEIVTADGRKANKLFFFTWLPHNATPHNKMAYSHGKVTVRQRLEGLYDVAASSFSDIEVALGLVDEDEELSDIDF